MTITNEELLRKATLTTDDFGTIGEAPLTVDQVDQFITLLAADQALLSDVRRVTNNASKWIESVVEFGGRITRPGTQGTRLEDKDRAKPEVSTIEMSTHLQRSEVPISDESLEDNIARGGFANTLETLIADQAGFDLEELMLNGDTDSDDNFLAQLDGWLKQLQGPDGNVLDASGLGQNYQRIFRRLLTSIHPRFKRGLRVDGRFYVPVAIEEMYRDALSSRNTDLGDLSLTGTAEVRYQGIPIRGVPGLEIDADDNTSAIILTNRNNLYAGFRRAITMETFRDPREGATSFIVTSRVDAKVAFPQAAAVATGVNADIDYFES